MNKGKGISVVLVPLIIVIGSYVVFYPRINCKPDHVSFWFIFALGMAVGISFTRMIQWLKERNNK